MEEKTIRARVANLIAESKQVPESAEYVVDEKGFYEETNVHKINDSNIYDVDMVLSLRYMLAKQNTIINQQQQMLEEGKQEIEQLVTMVGVLKNILEKQIAIDKKLDKISENVGYVTGNTFNTAENTKKTKENTDSLAMCVESSGQIRVH